MSRQVEDLEAIFRAALRRVDPFRMIADHVRAEGKRLVIDFDGYRHEENLSRYDRIVVMGAGKASARMALALEQVLGDRITEGLVVVKYGHGETLSRIKVMEAGHPTPDAQGVRAAQAMADMARRADGKTLVVTLISGGGSALLPAPLSGLGLDDKQAVTRALLACGADIGQINCVRKHLSTLKGGRLLSLLAPARSLNLILSDVVGDRLDTIASGLTSPDDTSFADALGIIDSFDLRDQLPAAVVKTLTLGADGGIPESLKPGDPAAALSANILIGTNRTALLAACEAARARGYAVTALTSSLTGEAREVAKLLFAVARDTRDGGLLTTPPACIIAGGETTVTLRGSGKGGRNQELALAVLAEMAREPGRGRRIHVLSAATDGGDGPTDAAGAFASAELLEAAERAGLSWDAALRDNDAYPFFDRLGGLLKTGPTMTNVCDLQITLVDEGP
ncbi:glycerate kinase [Paramagnetospirillum kuznetsovii]|uniref:Glycerate kinase n=1 Tax=Paramagnetospirillum kuznetsovii TaxID=2053833 RepID=A0A364P0F8_9PROT|nr:glycerate kinase [Paramagnetospirillum kuznetsovii]RAU22828.1 glycerate kinase [Paramagnetospirillum kuznetsovii]